MVDGETYGCVDLFCYLGDSLNGGADLAATNGIRSGRMMVKDRFPFLTQEMKDEVCAISSIIYGSKHISLIADVGLKFRRAEMQMDGWRLHKRQKD